MLDQIEQKLSEEQLYNETIGHQSNYVVRLPVFEGPLDLLLHLIEKRQMEITTISLMAVTDQYLAYLQQWEEMTAQAGRAGQAGRPPAGRPPGSPLHVDDDSLAGRPQAGRLPGSPLHVDDDAPAGRPPGSPLHVARMGNMAAFVAIAARLLFIKSQSLLPQTSKDEVTGEMESAAELAEELQRHLVE